LTRGRHSRGISSPMSWCTNGFGHGDPGQFGRRSPALAATGADADVNGFDSPDSVMSFRCLCVGKFKKEKRTTR
jgi:hypothetical protein